MVGFLAYSIAGKDKGNIYEIIKEDRSCVWLADGRDRQIDNPKKKNKKHVQVIKKNIVNEDISFSDEDVRMKIKRYINKN